MEIPMYKAFEFVGAMIRTGAAIIITTLWLSTPTPIALIIPGDVQIPMVLNSQSFIQETIPDYSDGEERNPIKEYEVQVTGGEFSRLQQRNLYEETRDHFYIITRNCNQDALMDFATVRVNVDTGYVEIEFDLFNTVCTVVDTTYGRPNPDEIPFP
jgi:hypothetical protein